MNILNKIRRFFLKIEYDFLLSNIECLERDKKFITPFFCGQTSYPIRLKEQEIKISKAKIKLENIQEKLNK
ncbi:MAG: hypothetical protein WC438_06340 [Candidatus Pacearchaeota archaeon]